MPKQGHVPNVGYNAVNGGGGSAWSTHSDVQLGFNGPSCIYLYHKDESARRNRIYSSRSGARQGADDALGRSTASTAHVHVTPLLEKLV